MLTVERMGTHLESQYLGERGRRFGSSRSSLVTHQVGRQPGLHENPFLKISVINIMFYLSNVDDFSPYCDNVVLSPPPPPPSLTCESIPRQLWPKPKPSGCFSLLYGVRGGFIPRHQQPREACVLPRLCPGLGPVWVGGPQHYLDLL